MYGVRAREHKGHGRGATHTRTDRSAGAIAATALVALLCLGPAVAGADGSVIEFSLEDRIRVSERTNLLRTENDRYVGLMNRQVTGYLTRSSGTESFNGRMLVYEETLRDLSQIGRPVDASYSTTLEVDATRAFVLSDRVPPYLSIPTLPVTPVSAMDSWSAPGRLIIDLPHGLAPVTVDVEVGYRYAGTEMFGGELVHRIEAGFAVRYPPPPDPDANEADLPPVRPEINRIAGRHTLSILLPADSAAPFFIRDEIEEQYDLAGAPRTLVRGHTLLFVYGLSTQAQEQIARDIEARLQAAETADVVVEQTDAGTRLTIQDIRFVPDQAVILESDSGRLSQVAQALASVDGVRFLIVGHTADVGTQESQVDLSWERARVVVAELVERGLDPLRFDVEGRGGREPVASNDTEAGRARNRRVEIYILEE